MLVYLSIGDRQEGPYSVEELRQKVQEGEIVAAETLAWHEGLPSWCPLQSVLPKAQVDSRSQSNPSFLGRITDHVTTAAGSEKIEGFSLGNFFSEVFSKHDEDKIEASFAVGTQETTPPLELVDANWPKPWLFFRCLCAAVIVYAILLWGYRKFENPNLLPGIMLVGSFGVPIATLVLFFEVNVLKNLSVYRVIKGFMLGGVLALIGCLFLFEILSGWNELLGASVAGLTEEPAKLLAAIWLVRQKNISNPLNGLLLGAAVGAGFAAFESAGYAFNIVFDSHNQNIALLLDGATSGFTNPVQAMIANIETRGLLSPLAHIVWTAISMAAFVHAKGIRPISMEVFKDFRFWRVFGIAILLHMAWNSQWLHQFTGYFGWLGLGLIAWIIMISQMQRGLKEIKHEQSLATHNLQPSPVP
ncbi:PrsW family glutamic-type intramembrane protease [Phragmitibacter flavus]|nr:PrsW family glutamic-type intramembrane protease [Phragmitibacter flavus]